VSRSVRAILYSSGLLIYAASFFMVAHLDFVGKPVSGFEAAGMPGVMATILINDLLRRAPFFLRFFEYAAVFAVAFINPIFLMCAVLSPFRPGGRGLLAYRVFVPLMIPFCWIIFHYENYFPRAGHFVWISGMLFVLASGYSINQPGPALAATAAEQLDKLSSEEREKRIPAT